MTHTTPDQQTAETLISESAPDAYELTEVTAHCGAELHSVFLDPSSGTVWHAYADLDVDGNETGPWRVDEQPAAEAVGWIEESCCHALDRIADPSLYAMEHADLVEDDRRLVGELTDLHAACAAGQDEQAVDAYLEGRRQAALAKASLASMIRADYLRSLVSQHDRPSRNGGAGWGGKTETARRIGRSAATLGQLLAADDERWQKLELAAEQARAHAHGDI